MRELARIFVPRLLIALILSLGIAGACTYAAAETRGPAGSDVFTTPREALLREKPSRDSKILARLPQGTRLTLVETRDRFLRVEGKGLPPGWIADQVVVVFAPTSEATRELVVVGRAFAGNETQRLLAACLLDRAAQRLREAKTPDPDVEVLLGETLEALAATGGPYRAELGLTERTGPSGSPRRLRRSGLSAGGRSPRRRRRAPNAPGRANGPGRGSCGCSSGTGRLRSPACCRKRTHGSGSSRRPKIPRSSGAPPSAPASRRWRSAGTSSPSAGPTSSRSSARGSPRRASGSRRSRRAPRTDAASPRGLRSSSPCGATARPRSRRRHASRRGPASGPCGSTASSAPCSFPSKRAPARRATSRPGRRRSRSCRCPGPCGSLPTAGRSPGSRWPGPSQLVPVMTSLERDEPAREIAFLASGRPLRDRALAHVVGSLAGFSTDGQRLGLAIDAWNATPGPAPRYSVVSVATGELLFETSSDLKSFRRLLQ